MFPEHNFSHYNSEYDDILIMLLEDINKFVEITIQADQLHPVVELIQAVSTSAQENPRFTFQTASQISSDPGTLEQKLSNYEVFAKHLNCQKLQLSYKEFNQLITLLSRPDTQHFSIESFDFAMENFAFWKQGDNNYDHKGLVTLLSTFNELEQNVKLADNSTKKNSLILEIVTKCHLLNKYNPKDNFIKRIASQSEKELASVNQLIDVSIEVQIPHVNVQTLVLLFSQPQHLKTCQRLNTILRNHIPSQKFKQVILTHLCTSAGKHSQKVKSVDSLHNKLKLTKFKTKTTSQDQVLAHFFELTPQDLLKLYESDTYKFFKEQGYQHVLQLLQICSTHPDAIENILAIEKNNDINELDIYSFAHCRDYLNHLNLLVNRNLNNLFQYVDRTFDAAQRLNTGIFCTPPYMKTYTYTDSDISDLFIKINDDPIALECFKDIFKFENDSFIDAFLKRYIFAEYDAGEIYNYLYGNGSEEEAEDFGDYAKSGTGPFKSRTPEHINALRDSSRRQKFRLDKHYGFLGFTSECTKWEMRKFAYSINAKLTIIPTKYPNQFPGPGFILEDIHPGSFLPWQEDAIDPLSAAKRKIVSWMADNLNSLPQLKIYLFRGFISLAFKGSNTGLPVFEDKIYSETFFNEHFANPTKEVSVLAPNADFRAAISAIEAGEDPHDVFPNVISMLQKIAENPAELLFPGTSSVTPGALCNAFLPTSEKYFDWEFLRSATPVFDEWSDIIGHVHPSFITGSHQSYEKSKKDLKILQKKHHEINRLLISMENYFKLFDFLHSNAHKGFSTRDPHTHPIQIFTSDQADELSDYIPANNSKDSVSGQFEDDQNNDDFKFTVDDERSLGLQNNPRRYARLQSAFEMNKYLRSINAPKSAFKILSTMPRFSHTKFIRNAVELDTYDLRLTVAGIEHQLNLKDLESAKRIWDHVVVPRFGSHQDEAYRFIDREVEKEYINYE